jgi:hypothetical protein
MIDEHTLETWDKEQWRSPDVWADHSKVGLGIIAIWYGPGGRKGDSATLLEMDEYTVEVSEYMNTEGYFDEPPPDQFLVTKTGIDVGDIVRVLKARGVKVRSRKDFARWAVGIAVAHLFYWGGEEGYESELPA